MMGWRTLEYFFKRYKHDAEGAVLSDEQLLDKAILDATGIDVNNPPPMPNYNPPPTYARPNYNPPPTYARPPMPPGPRRNRRTGETMEQPVQHPLCKNGNHSYNSNDGCMYCGHKRAPAKAVKSTSAISMLEASKSIMQQRAKDYDQPEGERSMGATVEAFNIITRRSGERVLSESEGWLLMQILKDVRDRSTTKPHRDSLEDGVSYSALKAEARLREDKPSHAQTLDAVVAEFNQSRLLDTFTRFNEKISAENSRLTGIIAGLLERIDTLERKTLDDGR